MTTRHWMRANRARCENLSQTEIATMLGVSRQRIKQLCAAEDIETRPYRGGGKLLRQAPAIRRKYRLAFQSHPPLTSWREVAAFLGVEGGTERAWRQTLPDTDQTKYAAKLAANKLAKHGPPIHAQIAAMLKRRPRYYTTTYLAEELGITVNHATVELRRAVELNPRLDKLRARHYRKRT